MAQPIPPNSKPLDELRESLRELDELRASVLARAAAEDDDDRDDDEFAGSACGPVCGDCGRCS